jgi:hypothetical protein
MPKDALFEQHSGRYEAWFDAHDETYVSELLALRIFVPLTGRGLEIGVGSGRFAAALGIQVGIDRDGVKTPSQARRAVSRVHRHIEHRSRYAAIRREPRPPAGDLAARVLG